MLVFLIFAALVVVGTLAAYHYADEGFVVINGQTVTDLAPWEVAGGIAIGIIFAMIALLVGVIGLAIGLVATVVSIALALAGVAVGLFITAG